MPAAERRAGGPFRSRSSARAAASVVADALRATHDLQDFLIDLTRTTAAARREGRAQRKAFPKGITRIRPEPVTDQPPAARHR
jgi:hypothetical protein